MTLFGFLDLWRQQHNNIALADLGVNMNEDQLVIQIKGKLNELWNVAQAFPDLLAWQP